MLYSSLFWISRSILQSILWRKSQTRQSKAHFPSVATTKASSLRVRAGRRRRVLLCFFCFFSISRTRMRKWIDETLLLDANGLCSQSQLKTPNCNHWAEDGELTVLVHQTLLRSLSSWTTVSINSTIRFFTMKMILFTVFPYIHIHYNISVSIVIWLILQDRFKPAQSLLRQSSAD